MSGACGLDARRFLQNLPFAGVLKFGCRLEGFFGKCPFGLVSPILLAEV